MLLLFPWVLQCMRPLDRIELVNATLPEQYSVIAHTHCTAKAMLTSFASACFKCAAYTPCAFYVIL